MKTDGTRKNDFHLIFLYDLSIHGSATRNLLEVGTIVSIAAICSAYGG